MKLNKLRIVSLAVLFFAAFHSSCFADLKEQAEKYREEGYKAQKRGDFRSAITFYTKAVNINPDLATVYNDIGVLYESVGQLELAEENYLKAIAVNKDYLAVYTNLAYLYEKNVELKKSAYFLKKRIELGDQADFWTKNARFKLLNLIATSSEVKSMFTDKEIRKLIEDSKIKKVSGSGKEATTVEEHLNLGKQYYKERKYQEARDEFQRAFAVNP